MPLSRGHILTLLSRQWYATTRVGVRSLSTSAPSLPSSSSSSSPSLSVSGFHAGGESLRGQEVVVRGWLRSARVQKSFAFLEVLDGSSVKGVQVVVDADILRDAGQSWVEKQARTASTTISQAGDDLDRDDFNIKSILGTGSSIEVVGKVVESQGKSQGSEIAATHLNVVGECPPTGYPLQKKRHTTEFLRSILHLRHRTLYNSSVARIRHRLMSSIHTFFDNEEFLHVHSPILTSSDCEGAGELFKVTTTDGKPFFDKDTYLSVSGQLHAEAMMSGLSKVYTFGPTFRAENSNTGRHLAEFTMVEPELAFADVQDVMGLAERMIKASLSAVLDRCADDVRKAVEVKAFEEKDKSVSADTHLEKLESYTKANFERMTLEEAVAVLKPHNKHFEEAVTEETFGTEHEKFLAGTVVDGPVFVYNYPKGEKPFYGKQNDDGKTVAMFDMLVPEVGELIGGGQREDRLDALLDAMKAKGVDPSLYEWYVDLRRFGSVPHGGYGLGFERMVQFVCKGINIRDTVPFPRYPGHCPF